MARSSMNNGDNSRRELPNENQITLPAMLSLH
jgi:hypothetical protein